MNYFTRALTQSLFLLSERIKFIRWDVFSRQQQQNCIYLLYGKPNGLLTVDVDKLGRNYGIRLSVVCACDVCWIGFIIWMDVTSLLHSSIKVNESLEVWKQKKFKYMFFYKFWSPPLRCNKVLTYRYSFELSSLMLRRDTWIFAETLLHVQIRNPTQ